MGKGTNLKEHTTNGTSRNGISTPGVKFRPKDAKLVPDTPAQPDAVPDQYPSGNVSTTIITDTTAPPPGVENAQQIEPTHQAQAAQQQASEKNGWSIGQYTFGRRKFLAKFPVKVIQQFSNGMPVELPKLQHDFDTETTEAKDTRLERLAAVKESFKHSWEGYKKYAWLKDEVGPLDANSHQTFGGWAATLVDSLDTLWIMGMKEDFEEAVEAVQRIDFTETDTTHLNIFETTIRYIGGFLGAYDVSNGKYPVLLEKATQVGELLYCAFDTPNHMPVTRWPWKDALEGATQTANTNTIVAEIGSLTLEFTRLSQLTGDPKFFDATARIMSEFQKSQSLTRLPGLWPTVIDAKHKSFDSTGFTLGGMADSLYEYLPKQHMLLGGRSEGIDYKAMYQYAITAAMNHVFFQPMLPDQADILLSGNVDVHGKNNTVLQPHGQHLACYAGGMVGVGAKIFERPEHVYMARKLVDGCIWAYQHMPTGIMPESFQMVPCEMNSDCIWDEAKYENQVHRTAAKYASKASDDDTEPTVRKPLKQILKELRLSEGFTDIQDRRYILRPEAIESVFIHYRLTGDKDLPNAAWQMFQSIENATRTDIAHAAIADVTQVGGEKVNSMESFWLAETLKYFYLIFSEPGVVDLDEFVLNTEAHPFRRPTPGKPVTAEGQDFHS
ncbi:MAG: hypothetical protein Q9217_001998 [Psora testacea]